MRLRDLATAVLLISSLALSAPAESPAEFITGSTYTVSGTNFPTDFGPETVRLDQTTKIINNGPLALTETIIPALGGSQWIDLNFQRVGGGPLASDPNARWQLGNVDGLQLSQPGYLADAFLYFTVNAAPVNSGLRDFSGFLVRTNPIDPAAGEVLGFVGFPPNPHLPPNDVISAYVFVDPYAAGLSALGVDPNAINGVHLVMLETPASAPVPEPSSLISGGIALALGLGYAWRRHRRATTAT